MAGQLCQPYYWLLLLLLRLLCYTDECSKVTVLYLLGVSRTPVRGKTAGKQGTCSTQAGTTDVTTCMLSWAVLGAEDGELGVMMLTRICQHRESLLA
jgi:hypothetical protein